MCCLIFLALDAAAMCLRPMLYACCPVFPIISNLLRFYLSSSILAVLFLAASCICSQSLNHRWSGTCTQFLTGVSLLLLYFFSITLSSMERRSEAFLLRGPVGMRTDNRLTTARVNRRGGLVLLRPMLTTGRARKPSEKRQRR